MLRKIIGLLIVLVTSNNFAMEISSLLNIEGNQDIIEDLFKHNARQIFEVNEKAVLHYIRITDELERDMLVKFCMRRTQSTNKRKKNFIFICPLCITNPKSYIHAGSLVGHMEKSHDKKIIKEVSAPAHETHFYKNYHVSEGPTLCKNSLSLR